MSHSAQIKYVWSKLIQQTISSGLQIPWVFLFLYAFFSPNPMFDHLLESSHWDASYKWSNIGYGEEIKQIELNEVHFRHLILSSVSYFYTKPYSVIIHSNCLGEMVWMRHKKGFQFGYAPCLFLCSLWMDVTPLVFMKDSTHCEHLFHESSGLQIRCVFLFLKCLFLDQSLCLTTC